MGGLKILPLGLLKTWGEPCGARIKRRCGVMTAAPAETRNVPNIPFLSAPADAGAIIPTPYRRSLRFARVEYFFRRTCRRKKYSKNYFAPAGAKLCEASGELKRFLNSWELFVEFAACFRLFVCDKIGTQRSVLHI